MPDTPTQRPASTSDARKRAADLATPDRGSDLRGPLDLDAIRARADAATGGPWGVLPGIDLRKCRPADVRFIVAARTDVLALLAEVERLRRDLVDALDERYAESDHKAAKFWRAKREADIRAEKAERALRELQSESRILPCDGACTDAPEEDCSRHGREPAELWCIIGEIQAERDAARETMARVEALADEWERNYASMLIAGFSGASVGADTAAKRIRAALAQPATDEGWLARESKRARERAASVPPHARPTTLQPATDEGAGV